MIEISIPLNIKFTIDDEIDIINLSQKIKDLEIEKQILHQFIKKYDEMITTALCGVKYERKKDKKYERASFAQRTIITLLGKSDFKVNKIKDTKTGDIFKPTLQLLGIERYKNIQNDISFTAADIATKSTYRDTTYILKNFTKSISPSTINRHVIKWGKKIKKWMNNKNKENNNEKYEYFYSDGTLSHSQEKNIYKNDIKVAITTNPKGEKVLLSCNVNKTWSELNEEIDEQKVLKTDAVLVSDGEPGLKNALATGERKFQLDFIHFIRDIGYKLWSDKNLKLDIRKKLIKRAEKIIYKLKNQMKKYKNNKKTLKIKINETVDKLKEFSKYLHDLGSKKAANFVRKYSNHVVTFAILQTEGRDIPWNSNIVERLMGEIQKRCKHKWMRWTTQGQESILNLILTRYTNPQNYTEFKNKILKTKKINKIKIKITT